MSPIFGYEKCDDFTYCGMKEKHPVYHNRMNCLKSDIKKKKQLVHKLEQQVKSMQDFTTYNEYHFIKNLTPQLQAAHTTYKVNRVKLLRDIRILRKCLDGRIPEVTPNDAEQLKALLAKCKRTMQQDCRDFPEDAHIASTNSPASGINLNVSFSPVHNSNSCMDSVHVPDEPEKKVKRKRDKRKKKRSRKSSSSDSESEPSHTCRNVRKSKRKIPFEQDLNVLPPPPPHNPYAGQLGAGQQYLPYMLESTPSVYYPFQQNFPFNQQFRNQQFRYGHQNIQNHISSPLVGYTSMPMAVTEISIISKTIRHK